MKKIRLGNTKLQVSPLCFGTEPFTIKKGPIRKKSQGDRSPGEGGNILKKALKFLNLKRVEKIGKLFLRYKDLKVSNQ